MKNDENRLVPTAEDINLRYAYSFGMVCVAAALLFVTQIVSCVRHDHEWDPSRIKACMDSGNVWVTVPSGPECVPKPEPAKVEK